MFNVKVSSKSQSCQRVGAQLTRPDREYPLVGINVHPLGQVVHQIVVLEVLERHIAFAIAVPERCILEPDLEDDIVPGVCLHKISDHSIFILVRLRWHVPALPDVIQLQIL